VALNLHLIVRKAPGLFLLLLLIQPATNQLFRLLVVPAASGCLLQAPGLLLNLLPSLLLALRATMEPLPCLLPIQVVTELLFHLLLVPVALSRPLLVRRRQAFFSASSFSGQRRSASLPPSSGPGSAMPSPSPPSSLGGFVLPSPPPTSPFDTSRVVKEKARKTCDNCRKTYSSRGFKNHRNVCDEKRLKCTVRPISFCTKIEYRTHQQVWETE